MKLSICDHLAGAAIAVGVVANAIACRDQSCRTTLTCPPDQLDASSNEALPAAPDSGTPTGTGDAPDSDGWTDAAVGQGAALSDAGINLCSNTEGCSEEAPLCTAGGSCVQCAANPDCPRETPTCSDNDCVCTLASDVLASDPANCGACGHVCEPSAPSCLDGRCVLVSCLLSSDCTESAPICSPANVCVQCSSSADCSEGAAVCADGRCVECLNSADCASNSATSICSPFNECVECLDDADCSSEACSAGQCGDNNQCLFESGTDLDDACGTCGVCDGTGAQSCMAVAAGLDPQNECSTLGCGLGGCDGEGACQYEFGTDLEAICSTCQVCDGSGNSSCMTLPAGQDARNECGTFQCGSGTCASNGACGFEDGTDADNTCGACHVCDGSTLTGCREVTAGTEPEGRCGQPAPPTCHTGACSDGICASNATRCYRDADNDGFGTSESQIFCAACPSGWVAETGDCYDDNVDAHPGQTAGFGEDRGDGSFDYNCDGDDEELPIHGVAGCIGSCAGGTCESTGVSDVGIIGVCGGNVSFRPVCALICPAPPAPTGGCQSITAGTTQLCR